MESKSRLEEIAERERKATAGPWVEQRTETSTRVLPAEHRSDLPESSPYKDDGKIPVGIDAICTMQVPNSPNWRNDRAFIAHAREDVPYLLKMVGFWKMVAELMEKMITPNLKAAKLRAAAELGVELGEVE